MKIFISSTYEDLKDERKEAIEYIDRNDHAVAMEKFFASNHQSKDVCLKKLQDCDALVLILGFKYGSIDKTEGISFTEIEYNTAKALGLPVFVFLKHRHDGIWRPEETESERESKLTTFKSRLDSERFRVLFVTPQDLSREIAGAVHNYERAYGLLGVRLPAFASYEEFFRPFTNNERLFNHLYSLVGREDYLKALDKFVESNKRLGLLYGRGGIGKSKILFELGREFEKKHKGWQIRFLKEGVPISDDTIKQLPAEKCVLAVDDAHRREDLDTLLAIGQQYSDRIKIILSSRPQGMDYLRGLLTRMAFDPREIENLPEMGHLGIDEMEKLAAEVLGQNNQRLIEPLVNVAKYSPLVLVIGGRLVAEGAVAPAMLERHDEFQRAVLDRYQDVFTGQISDRIGEDLCRDLLSLISAVSPIRPQNELFQNSASKFLKIEATKLIDAISSLESAGVLLRRGYSLRITPDVLSDHILHKTCLTEQGEPTGYTKKVFGSFGPVVPENVLFNLSELDWRITREGKSLDLLWEVWEIIWNDFRDATHSQRVRILEIIEKAAHLQPGKTLELIEYAMNNPSKKTDDAPWTSIYKYTHKDVLEALPGLLQGVAYNLDYMSRCCDILWQLGRDDERETGPRPEHAIRVLIDMAGYDIGKPIAVNTIVLEAVERWLKQPATHEHIHSPLDILDPLLVKEVGSARSRGHGIVFRPFAVSFETTRGIRERAISILSDCLESKSTKVVLQALRSLAETLNPPHGLFGRHVSDDEVAQWLPEQMVALAAIERLVKRTEDPIIFLQVASELRWHAKRNSQKGVRDKAALIMKAIPDSFDLKLCRCLCYRYEIDLDNEDHEQYQRRIKDNTRRIAKGVIERFEDGKEIFQILDEILSNFDECNINCNPGYFLHEISKVDFELAVDICRTIISNPSSLLASYLSPLLSGIREKNKNIALDLARSALATNNASICSSLAHGYSWWGWAESMDKEEIGIIEELLRNPDKAVKHGAIESLRNFPDIEVDTAISLALSVEIGEDEQSADILCRVFGDKQGISADNLKDKDLKSFLQKIVKIKKLDSRLYHLDRFLGYCSKRIPETVVDFLLQRLDLAEEMRREDDYQPLPYTGFHHGLKGISLSTEYRNILTKIRDCALKSRTGDYFWLPKLFKEVSAGFPSECLEVLSEWVHSQNARKIETVAFLLQDAHPGFVFSHSEFATNLLEKAHEVSDHCYQDVESYLFISATSGVSSGAAGQPMPQDVRLRDQAEEFSLRLPAGSPAQKFYLSLKRHAENRIRDQQARDEEFFEG